uniref:Hypothetical secreted peptide n=1 Tax=Glossina morsitans morsitans TaxID=37546 RepID=D3TSS4_GLOMM
MLLLFFFFFIESTLMQMSLSKQSFDNVPSSRSTYRYKNHTKKITYNLTTILHYIALSIYLKSSLGPDQIS